MPERLDSALMASPLTEPETQPEMLIYRLEGYPPMRIVPAPVDRKWMQAGERQAKRCLPLVMANQAGWVILNDHRFHVTWNGSEDPDGVSIKYVKRAPPNPVTSHFGCGIITFKLGFLFRTPPGFNLVVRGPTNWIKDGICPLDGLIETDWLPYPFSMNWKLTRPNAKVTFQVDDPICMFFPQRRGELEGFGVRLRDIATNPDLATACKEWGESRLDHLRTIPGTKAEREPWQRYYLRGSSPRGDVAANHQIKLKLRDPQE